MEREQEARSSSSVVKLGAIAILYSGLTLLSGCYAGLAGLVLGFIVISENGGGGMEADSLPVVTEFHVDPLMDPDRVPVQFRIESAIQGRLSAEIEYANLDLDPNSTDPASRTPESGPPEVIVPGRTVSFVWDCCRSPRARSRPATGPSP
ncbi:MAG: hypothetical protein HY717_13870 [Planctomycetes bacterium]|nr:hypothetical protein [Planctomycetota bacterium]